MGEKIGGYLGPHCRVGRDDSAAGGGNVRDGEKDGIAGNCKPHKDERSGN